MKNIHQSYFDWIYNGKIADDEDVTYEYNDLKELPYEYQYYEEEYDNEEDK